MVPQLVVVGHQLIVTRDGDVLHSSVAVLRDVVVVVVGQSRVVVVVHVDGDAILYKNMDVHQSSKSLSVVVG